MTVLGRRTRNAFLARLPHSTWVSAKQVAEDEGISLNQLVTMAVAEKLARLDAKQAFLAAPAAPEPRPLSTGTYSSLRLSK